MDIRLEKESTFFSYYKWHFDITSKTKGHRLNWFSGGLTRHITHWFASVGGFAISFRSGHLSGQVELWSHNYYNLVLSDP